MHRKIILLLALGALMIAGCRDLVTPTQGYAVIENVLSPVQIRTKDLEGAGWIQARLPGGQWEVIHLSPGGAFNFHEPLPLHVWHCDPENGSHGCVAQLKVGDEKGAFGTGKAEASIFVCTEDYVQKVGRMHCGHRGLHTMSGFQKPKMLGERGKIRFAPFSSRGAGPIYDFGDIIDPQGWYYWNGDPMSRFYAGADDMTDGQRLAYHPPAEVHVSDWHEWPYSTDGYNGLAPIVADGLKSMSLDIGACSLFIPYKWEDRLDDPIFTPKIGEMTDNLGVGELFVQGILDDPPEPTRQIKDNVMLWMDAAAYVETRTDVSPEFHFNVRGSGASATPQMCLKTYMNASTSLQSGIDAWYRWDQGFLSALASLFNIGTCKSHPASLMYCGTPSIEDGKGTFTVDSQSIWVNIEGYSVFKPACRNQFEPQIKDGLREGALTAGQENLSDGIDQFVTGFQNGIKDVLGRDILIRRLELAPSGIYVVLAENASDPQYGLGNCVSDLHRTGSGVTAPYRHVPFTSRGITMEVQ